MSEDRRTDELTEFGLTGLQAKIYVALLELGVSTAKRSARVLKIHRVEAYRVMKELTKLGLVEEILGRPMRYKAVSPEVALQILLSREASRLRMLTEKAKEIKEWLIPIQSGRAEVVREEHMRFQMVVGRKSAYSRLLKMIESANNEVVSMLTKKEMSRLLLDELDDVQLRCAQRGVKIRVVTEVDENNINEIRSLFDFCEVRHSSNLASDIHIVDGREMLFSVGVGEEILGMKEEAYVWTDNLRLVRTMHHYFEHVWRTSTDVTAAPALMETVFDRAFKL